MAEHKYSFEKYKPETMSKAVGRTLPVSTKHCIEICNHLRGRKLGSAKKILQQAVDMERPIPFKRFNDDVGHKKGSYSSARYPVKAASAILKLVESCEANAQNKALNTEEMVIVHMNAHRGSQQFRHGRHRRRMMKRTHVEVVLEEVSKKEDKKKKKTVEESKPAKKENEEPKETPKQAEVKSTKKTTTKKTTTKKTQSESSDKSKEKKSDDKK